MMKGLIHISVGGETHQLNVGGETIYFEMHRFCGPMPINKVSLSERRLSDTHKFWQAVTYWCRQGQQKNQDDTCKWSGTILSARLLKKQMEQGPADDQI